MYPQSPNPYTQTSMAANSWMEDQDLAYTVLADLKRVCREYTTAATESNCPAVRQMFVSLLNDSLQLQAELYHLMQQQGWYNTSSPAIRSELDKQVQQYRQSEQKTRQWAQQHRSQPQQPIPPNQTSAYTPLYPNGHYQ
ncbi:MULTISPECIES: spore coat protein [Alicyclobacillus]|uniref:Spore coat protein CotF n=2 Tax=Alicyclobacillus tolerans TaxID=90970 RepID=A0ABT9LSI9_9BACL|nr:MULTISPECIES: spore coat protein [Alicyclobacillus]MDP9727225.1 spore coat protein CotF [Alicyclobacillus tengchongensis]SHJ57724.1 Coat F domain-containing protein [Alicyclobacillus montanus]